MALEKIVKNSSGVPTGEYERIAGGTLYADNPIGAIVPFGGTDIPAGFLLCNGAEVLKTDYAELYAVIGDAFGTASVNTKFVLPDLREATTKGAGLTGKTVGAHVSTNGLSVGEFLDDRIQDHNHTAPISSQYGTSMAQPGSGVTAANAFDTYMIKDGTARKGATTEVKSVGVNYIIKAKMVAVPADFLAKVDEAVEDVYGAVIPSDASASNKLTTQDMFKVITTPAMTGVGNSNGNVKNYIPSGYTLVKVEAVGYDQHQVFFDNRGYVFVFSIDSTMTSNWREVDTSTSIAYKLYCVKFN